jgi:hypothetical protein
VAKNEIRLLYSGLVIFATKMISVATGLIFQLMIARAIIDPKDYDVWFNLNDVLSYFTLLAGVIPFWAIRFVARGNEAATKTGILANLVISAIATGIYVLLAPFMTSALGIGKYVLLYFLIAVQIVEIHFFSILEACLRAKKPQAIGYGLLISEVCKIVLGYVLIIQLGQPLLGALIGLIASFAIQIAYYFRLLKEELKQQVRWEYVKEWLKGSTVNIYNLIGNQIAAFIFIMLFIYGGDGGRSMYGLGASIAGIVTYSSFLAFALYPKLLAEKRGEDITTSLKMVLMFAIPMAAIAIALSDSFIIIMRPEYAEAQIVLVVLTLDALVITLSGFYSSVLYGVEQVDEKEKISLKQLFKSRLFIVFSLTYLHSIITLPAATYILANYAQNQPLQASLYVSIINSSARFAMFLILYAVVRKVIKMDIPWKSISKYTLASVIVGAILFVLPEHPTRLSLTLAVTAAAGVAYFGLLMAIDKEARMLAASVWQEIRFRFK